MKRRNFLTTSSLIGLGGALGFAQKQVQGATSTKDFQLKYAPHIGMFEVHAGKDPVDQLQFMADQGFRAFEDNGMKQRPLAEQLAMDKAMRRLGIEMGVFVAHKIYWNEPNLASGDLNKRAEFVMDIKDSVEVAKRVGATWMTVVPGTIDPRLDMGYQTANVIESLKSASDILEREGLVMVLEPLNFRDHPNLFLTKIAQAYQICKAVGGPSCKILFDIYHQQIQEGNIIPNIDLAWEEIAYFQVGDNPGRKEPTTGELNYKNIFRHIHSKDPNLIIGMEHGNSKEGKEGELAVIEAYRAVDGF